MLEESQIDYLVMKYVKLQDEQRPKTCGADKVVKDHRLANLAARGCSF